jgi:cytochrome c5
MTSTEEHNETHESFIKTPRQLIVTVILSFLIPIVVIIMLVHMVAASSSAGAGSDDSAKAVLSRIKPVAGLKLVDANAPKTYLTGKQVFDSTCTACHTAGVAGAPKVGNKADWAPFIKTGYQEMIKNAIHGIGAMPPKGGNASLSDYEVARAIAYMANQSGASFKEPPPPAPKAAAKPTAAAAAPEPAPAAAAPAPAKPAPAATEAAAAAKPAPAAGSTKVAAIPGLAPDAATNPEGQKLYKTVCFACHASGVMGAPTFGSMEKWAPFIKTGIDTMVKNAIHGVGNMPPRGGSQATDAQMRAAVEYMVSQAK